jgi:TRAP-type C4-dicarboxylate transport system substrate-binding protein
LTEAPLFQHSFCLLRQLLASLLLVGLSVSVSGAESIDLIVNQVAPPNHFYHKDVLVPWAGDVKRVTEGRVTLRFSVAPLGSYRRNFDSAWAGLVDIAGGNQSATPGRFIVTQINESPFLESDNVEAISVALWRTHERFLHVADEFSGTKLLALHASGTQHWFTVAKPIRRLSDMRGLKIAAPSDVGARLLSAVGAIPVFLTAPEIYDALSRGILDGVSMPYSGVTRLGLQPYLQYQTRLAGGVGLSFGGFFLVANEKSWSRISPADQAAILTISGEVFARRAAKVFNSQVARSEQELLAAGVVNVETAPGFDQELRKAVAFLDTNWIEKAKAANVDAEAALRYFRGEVQRQSERLDRVGDEVTADEPP